MAATPEQYQAVFLDILDRMQEAQDLRLPHAMRFCGATYRFVVELDYVTPPQAAPGNPLAGIHPLADTANSREVTQ